MKRVFLSAALALLATSALAQTKISQLPDGSTPLDGSEIVPVTQGPNTVKVTTQDIADLASATPGGATTQVQYNNAGAFAGDAGMVYSAATDTLTLLGNINVSGTEIYPNGSQATPTNGGTTNMAAGKRYLYMTPAGGIATYTVNLPSSPIDGQVTGLFTTQTITALTIGGQGGNTVTTTVTTLPANTGVEFMYFSGVWRQISGVVASTGPTTTSGTYAPTVTAIINSSAASAPDGCQYMQVGTVVNVSCRIQYTQTANGATTRIGITLPVASNFTQAGHLAGASNDPDSASSAAWAAVADPTNDRAELRGIAVGTGGKEQYAVFTYRIL